MSNFFDFREKIVKPTRAATTVGEAGGESATPLSVSQLTAKIDASVRAGLPGAVTVKGEISRPNYHRGSGHLYFTLKDAGACIDAVMWKSEVSRLKFEVENGAEMLASGRVQVYAPQGKYQLYVSRLSPVGAGALELALKQMRAKLAAEGLFDADRKKPLPKYPARIAIVTSRSTAALRDILKVLVRTPFVEVFVYHVPVQGDGAGRQIAAAIAHLNAKHASVGGIDLILLARGGGSIEDLWQFNEECVARAIAASALPIVTGIGHEIDTSIADLVADYHAHTPTEAATVAIAHWLKAAEAIGAAANRLRNAARSEVSEARQRLAGIARHEFLRRPTYQIDAFRQLIDERERALVGAMQDRLGRDALRIERLQSRLAALAPAHRLALYRQRVSDRQRRLERAMSLALQRRRLRLDAMAVHLRAVSPTAVLQRGYSITTIKKTGKVVRSSGELREGDVLVTRVGDGEVESSVLERGQGRLFE
jgi:exodeoxyribonuclease VII large subunit